MDHMNPYFAKHHHHAHSHGYRCHRHNYSNHFTPAPTAATAATALASETHEGSAYPTPTPTPSSCNSGLQTPVPLPRRSSLANADPPVTPSTSSLKSYNTPPATPPLSFPQTQIVVPSGANAATTEAQTPAPGGFSRTEPVAWCTARARIPTPDGSEYFLHIYENSQDKKEHLAFVFGEEIRSRSLDKVRPNESEMDRVKRGAYTGRLQPLATVSTDHSLISLPLFSQEQSTTLTSTLAGANTVNINVLASDVATAIPTVTTMASSTTTTVSIADQNQNEDTAMAMAPPNIPLVRIHSECFTGEIGHSARCDCGEQLDEAIRRMKEEGAGVVVYLRQEGRGIGLGEKIK